MEQKLRIAILGGGPSGLLMFKRLVESGTKDLEITVFEQKQQLGAGMPYSAEGANDEHITNVSGNEIPLIVTPIAEWIKTVPQATLDRFHVKSDHFNDFKVLPRLLFGQYLAAQFDLLLQKANANGIAYEIKYNSRVTDVADENDSIKVEVNDTTYFHFNKVVICTGHNWPKKREGIISGYFDSPYPPAKLNLRINHHVAIKGSSLTAVDAIRTIARNNGAFKKNKNGKLSYKTDPDCTGLKMVLHTRNGLFPAVRFHLEDSHLSNDSLLTPDEIAAHITANDGFLSLDFVFEKDFKEIFRYKEPGFYAHIKNMSVEDFVADMMALRENLDPFLLLKAEYREAAKSIKQKKSVYWKEMLGVLSFAMNYPAKHFSAEDMLRLKKVLLPLISIVIAYIPQASTEELLALHQAGLLEIMPVGEDSFVEPKAGGGATYHYTDQQGKGQSVHYDTFIDCVGQPHLSFDDFPFKSMINQQIISPARLKYRSADEGEAAFAKNDQTVEQDASGDYYLKVTGITINDDFKVLNSSGLPNNRIYIMAVPYIGGFNPDYSGLDFSEEASATIIKTILKHEPSLNRA